MKKFMDQRNRTDTLIVTQYQVLKKYLPNIAFKLQPQV